MLKTNVYVDGFNLYYGALKDSPYKWLDLLKLCQNILPKNQIQEIKYFTAAVSARPKDPDQPVRQQTYWRALKTLPNTSIIQGSFLSHPVQMPLDPARSGGRKNPVWVIKTEEKGSDVNIATHLLRDAYNKKFDVAILITNDSDLVEPVRIVSRELKLPVGIINPHSHNPKSKPSFQLQKHATFVRPVRKGVLGHSLFPTTMEDKAGTFTKPAGW